MGYTPPIRGKFLKKKPEPVKIPDLAGSVDGIINATKDLRYLKETVVNTLDDKIQEVDSTLDKATAFLNDSKEILLATRDEAIQVIKDIKQGEPGKDADEKAIEDRVLSRIPVPKDGISVDEKSVVEKVVALTKIDEKTLAKKVLEILPKNKASLKVITENITTDPMSVIDKIMELARDGKFKLKTDNVDGLDQTIASLRNQFANGKGYVHGGGFSNIYESGILVSNGLTGLNFTGSGVNSVTKNQTTGIITVDISGGGSSIELETNGTPNGNQSLLNLVQGTNMTITDDGLGNITFDSSGSGGDGTPYAETPSGTINSSNKVFTLAHAPSAAANTIVILDGVTQYEGIDYTVSGSTITFVTAPATGSTIFCYYNTILGGSLVLETNGTPNGSQILLNLVQGTNITLTDDGLGNITIDASGGGAVSSVANSDGTLTISPTTGSVVASLNLAHANTWTGLQTMSITGTAGAAGQDYGFKLTPTYNQTSTAAATDFLINRTQTAVGSGNQFFQDMQVAGSPKIQMSTAGSISMTGGLFTGLNGASDGRVTFGSTGGGFMRIIAPTGGFSPSYDWTLPSAQGGSNTFLKNNGSGTLSWASVTTGLVEQWGGNDINSSIGNNTYTIMLYAEYGMTINELKIISGSGTCTAAVKINGTNVTGISAVSVSSTIATGTASAANTVSTGDTVTLVLSSTSSLNNLQWTLKTTRT